MSATLESLAIVAAAALNMPGRKSLLPSGL
jgi:hypothetical protein